MFRFRLHGDCNHFGTFFNSPIQRSRLKGDKNCNFNLKMQKAEKMERIVVGHYSDHDSVFWSGQINTNIIRLGRSRVSNVLSPCRCEVELNWPWVIQAVHFLKDCLFKDARWSFQNSGCPHSISKSYQRRCKWFFGNCSISESIGWNWK